MDRLNVLKDFAFQKVFGAEGDELQLLGFLNATLEHTGKGNLLSVKILENKDLPAEITGHKGAKLDVLASVSGASTSGSDSLADVEVQIRNQYNIEKRSLCYWNRRYIWNFTSGSDYIDLVPVIAVNIVDYGLFPIEDFHPSFHLREDRHSEFILSDTCEIHFLDMVKWRKLKNSRFGGFLQEIRQIYETCVGLKSATTNRVVEQVQ
ncbi:MAG: Rpn family recombination-promoting nuclease/putative transposase [Treponema sp.]|jgi:predicted transposase/invertase (TIGR01784 family)|nr:Rpn family recombination-promoting nuclease/putative transposase [Treponema sp.]